MRYAVAAILALGSVSAHAMGDDAAKGTAGLAFKGNQAFTDRQLRSAILLDPVCVLAIRDTGAAGSLELIAERLRAGYLRMGYLNAKVTADRAALAVRIVESNRFRCGEVSVECGSTVPASEVIKAIHADAAWERDSFASFPIQTTQIKKAAAEVFEQYGFFGASIAVVSDPKSKTAEVALSVQIQPGPRSTIAGVEIQGTEENVRGLIGSVRESAPTPQLLDAVRTRLSEAKGFLRSSVAFEYPIAPGAPIQLLVSVADRRAGSSDTKMDDETVLNRFSDWLDDWSVGLVPLNLAFDFTITRSALGQDKPVRGRGILSNSGGSYLSLGDDPEAPEVSVTSFNGVLESVVWGARERCRMDPGTLTGDVAISSLPPGSDERSKLLGSIGVNDSTVLRPFQFAIDPEVIQRDFKSVSGSAEHLQLESKSATLMLERSTGQLVRFRLESSDGLLSFSVVPSLESAEAAVRANRTKAARFDRATIPVNLTRVLTVELGLPPHLLAALARNWSSLKQVTTINETTFQIPRGGLEGSALNVAAGSKWELGLLAIAVGCGPHAELDSKEFTLLRAVAMRTLGHPQLASAIAEPFVADTDLGPVNCWLAAMASLPNRTTFAARGLRVCSRDRIVENLRPLFRWSSGKSEAGTELAADPLIGYASSVLRWHLSQFALTPTSEVSVLAKKNRKKKKEATTEGWLDKPLDTSSFADSLRSGKRRRK